jgi:uridine kinase
MQQVQAIVGIAGGSGSGKSFLARELLGAIGPDDSALILQDNYYIDQSNKFDFDGGSVNFDHPDALDFDLLGTHLQDLKDGKSVQVPKYDFATHSRLPESIEQPPKKIIIVDGILILHAIQTRDIFSEKIFVSASEEVRFERRLKRDIETRGRTEEGVRNQFFKQVKPMHDKFVEPSRDHASYLVEGTHNHYEFIRLLLDKIYLK